MINLKNIRKVYRVGEVDVEAVKNVSFAVNDGEFVIIHGTSGSGKSTTLHLAGLLDEPSSGKIILDGKDVSRLDAESRTELRLYKMGYVFQEFNIVPELTALENTVLPALMTDKPKEAIFNYAGQILSYLGMGNRISHLPAELSGGQKQRVAIARALINNPKIIFADEPTANLDTRNSDIIVELFRKLNQERKITIIMVTHDPKYLRYANRVIYLEDGYVKKIVEKGSDDAFYVSQLRRYILKALKRRIPRARVRDELLKIGWPIRIIREAMTSGS